MYRTAFFVLQGLAMASAIRVLGIQFILGGDEDEYGCKGSAGYTWCNETDSCIPMNQLCTVLNLEDIDFD
jgi:hypothetical protein